MPKHTVLGMGERKDLPDAGLKHHGDAHAAPDDDGEEATKHEDGRRDGGEGFDGEVFHGSWWVGPFGDASLYHPSAQRQMELKDWHRKEPQS